ncbi:ABC transporter permease [Meiothermus cerbereus]|uniref:ABC transporter permease n=1 Tax=Meiothermus cerbereus TaxID=65552 RepID=UPI000488A56C|nr:ABC transporter permease subunit [Meiothermus cerbereus]
MKDALKIARKELLTYVREDRFWLMVFLPLVIMPLLINLPLLLMGHFLQQAQSRPQIVAIKGVSQEVQILLRQANFVVQSSPDPRKAVRERLAAVGLIYSEGRYTIFDQNSFLSLRLSAATEQTRQVLQRYKEQVLLERLQSRGLGLVDLEPFTIETQKAASEREQSLGLLALIIPLMLVGLLISGGQAMALEATVGEKEKGTIEALLSAPVAPWKLLLGKGLAVLVATVFPATTSFIGVVLGSMFVRMGFSGQIQALPDDLEVQLGTLALEPADLAAIFLTSVLLAFFVVAAMLALGIFARTYREANIYFDPLDMLVMSPLLLFFVFDFIKVQDWFFVLPGLGVVVAIDAIVKGTSSPWQLGLTWVSTLVYGLLVLYLAFRNFSREDVVFRN